MAPRPPGPANKVYLPITSVDVQCSGQQKRITPQGLSPSGKLAEYLRILSKLSILPALLLSTTHKDRFPRTVKFLLSLNDGLPVFDILTAMETKKVRAGILA